MVKEMYHQTAIQQMPGAWLSMNDYDHGIDFVARVAYVHIRILAPEAGISGRDK